MERLCSCYRTCPVIRDDYLSFAWGVVYLHTMCGEARCNCFQCFSDFVEQLVWRVCEDNDGKVIEKCRNRELFEVCGWLLVESLRLSKRNVGS